MRSGLLRLGVLVTHAKAAVYRDDGARDVGRIITSKE